MRLKTPSFLSALSAVAVVAALLLPLDARARSRASEDPGERGPRPISLVIETGYTLPAQPLLDLTAASGEDVRFDVVSGGIRFVLDQGDSLVVGTGGRTATFRATDGIISLPSIRPGMPDDEGFVRVTAAGRKLMEDLRIAILPRGGIEDLRKGLGEELGASVLALTDYYAIIDEEQLIRSGKVTDRGGVQHFEGAPCGNNLCTRVPWGPGEVRWKFSNPAGAGYSVKPETGSTLVWAGGSIQFVDGIYKNSWGCGLAFKIADSCTMEVYPGEVMECCCNAALYLLGHKCKLISPYSFSDWPNCPL